MRATMSMKPGRQDALTPRATLSWCYRPGRLALPAAMVLSGIVSVQVGAAVRGLWRGHRFVFADETHRPAWGAQA